MKLSTTINKFSTYDEIPKEGVLLGYGKSYGTYTELSGEWFLFSYSFLNKIFITDDGYGISNLEYWCYLPKDVKTIRLNKIEKILKNE